MNTIVKNDPKAAAAVAELQQAFAAIHQAAAEYRKVCDPTGELLEREIEFAENPNPETCRAAAVAFSKFVESQAARSLFEERLRNVVMPLMVSAIGPQIVAAAELCRDAFSNAASGIQAEEEKRVRDSRGSYRTPDQTRVLISKTEEFAIRCEGARVAALRSDWAAAHGSLGSAVDVKL